jgi:hypothetical protein
MKYGFECLDSNQAQTQIKYNYYYFCWLAGKSTPRHKISPIQEQDSLSI